MLLLFALLLPVALPNEAIPASERDGSRFGRAVLALGDLDGDGIRDIAVGAPTAVDQSGRVLVLSGADRSVLAVWEGQEGRPTFGHTLRTAGDVDGDGRDDVLVGHEFGARTEVRSGVSGKQLTAFDRRESEVHAFGDLDGDDRDDLLLTTDASWEVRCGEDGSFVAGPTFVRTEGAFHPVGDINGDGLTDGVLIGDETYLCRTTRSGAKRFLRRNPIPFERQQPIAKIWSQGLPKGAFETVRAAPAGDLDGDGSPDFVLAIRQEGRAAEGPGSRFRVAALSVAEPGPPLWVVEERTDPLHDLEDGYGYASARPGDLDGDGVDDLILARAVQVFDVRAEVRASAEGVRKWKLDDLDVGYMTGLSLATYDDHDGDGTPDILVGTSDWYWHGIVGRGGQVTLLSGKTGERLWSVGEADLEAHLGPVKKEK
ncbi:MAG: hypothetical protein AAGB93_05360 [Planctomycetota bacterium]